MSSHDEKPIITKYTKRFQNTNENLQSSEDNEEEELFSHVMDGKNSNAIAGSSTPNRLNLDVPKDSILNEYPYMKIQRETVKPNQSALKANTNELSVIYSITSNDRDLNKKASNSKENRSTFDHHSSPTLNTSTNEGDFREPNKQLKTDFNNSIKVKPSPVNEKLTPTPNPPTRPVTPIKQQPSQATNQNDNPILKNALNRRPVKLGVLPSNNKKPMEQNSTDTEALTILPSYKSSNINNGFVKRKVRILSPKTSDRFNSRPTTPSSTSSATIITMPKIQKPIPVAPSSITRPIIVENIHLKPSLQTIQQPTTQSTLGNKFYRPMYSNVLNPSVIYQEMPVLVETVQPLYMTTIPSYNDLNGTSAMVVNGSANSLNSLKTRVQLEKYPLTYAEQKTQQSNASPYIYKARPLQSSTYSQSAFVNKPLNDGSLTPTLIRNQNDEPAGLSVQKNLNSMQPKPLKSILKNSTSRNKSASLYAQNKNNVRINA
jgi:hypothetical protein